MQARATHYHRCCFCVCAAGAEEEEGEDGALPTGLAPQALTLLVQTLRWPIVRFMNQSCEPGLTLAWAWRCDHVSIVVVRGIFRIRASPCSSITPGDVWVPCR